MHLDANEGWIYLDHLATTPCLPEVVEAMLPYFAGNFHNPQSFHPLGQSAMDAVDSARQLVATLIGARSLREVFFASSATEVNNWVLKSTAAMSRRRGNHIVTSKIEHLSILHACRTLEKQGFEITYLSVDSQGFIDPDEVKQAIRPSTALVTLTHASNEIGTIEPIREIAAVCNQAGVPFHVDGSNTTGIIPMNVVELGIPMLTASPHMFYGPKGIATLYCHKSIKLPPLLEGGTQEDGRRAGTENVPAIVGVGKACELAATNMLTRAKHYQELRDQLIQGLQSMERVRITGHPTTRIPHHVSCVVDQVEGESILLSLVTNSQIHASSGSACSSKAQQQSYVLEAIGLDASDGLGSLVFGLGLNTTRENIRCLLTELPPIINRLRLMSPLG